MIAVNERPNSWSVGEGSGGGGVGDRAGAGAGEGILDPAPDGTPIGVVGRSSWVG